MGAVLAGVPGLLAACSSDSSNGATGDTAGGTVDVPDSIVETLRVGGILVGASSVDPLSRIGGIVAHQFADPLVWLAPGLEEPEPHLVTSWTTPTDRSMTFELKPGVKFHNGDELVAEDVKFSIDTILANGSGPASLLRGIESVTVDGPHTFTVTTAVKDPILLRRMYLVFPVPRGAYDPEVFKTRPIGTGAWKILEHDTAEQVLRCEANSDWWRGEITTSKVDFYGYADQLAQQAALEAGQVDVTVLPATANGTLKGRPGFTVQAVPMGSANVMTLNTQDGPFTDVRVRQAVNHAVNGDAIIDNVLFGAGYPMTGQVLGDDCYGHVPDFDDPYPYDPDKAKDLLREAGYPDGFQTEIRGNSNQAPAMEAIAGFLREVGIDARITPQEQSQWLTEFVRGSDAPMFLKPINYSPLYDADPIFNWMTAPAPGVFDDGFQAWTSAEWNDLLAESRSVDGDERKAVLAEMTQLLADEAPLLFLFFQTYTYGWVDGLSNFDPAPTGFFAEFHTTFKPA